MGKRERERRKKERQKEGERKKREKRGRREIDANATNWMARFSRRQR